ncbi:MAG: pre-peptidase C-terminal domain-containing protein [Hyphomonadaceae bacterium]|nr:pre-peptidase C-terminal domain-containing protein [Hyphomonadaceae bacterium]
MRAYLASVAFVLLSASALGQTPPSEQRLSGQITARAPRASYDLDLQAGQVVTLTTSSSDNLDTVLSLIATGGKPVAENDDQQPGVLSSRIVFMPPTSGRYTAVVSGFNNARGAFELTVTRGLDVGLSDAARTLREEALTLDAHRTEARYDVDLAAGEIFVASTYALSEGLDTTLSLRDAQGVVLAQNDDRGDGSLNSQLVYQPAGAGRYQVVVSTFSGDGAGDLMLSLAVDPQAEAPFNFASIAGRPIAHFEGTLDNETTQREFPVRLAAGQTVLVLADATSGNLDTVLRLNDAEGYPVAANDDRGDGSLNSAFAFTAPAAGQYTLLLERFAGAESSGAYRVALSLVERSVVDTLQALIENAVELSGPEQVIETQDFRLHYTLEGEDASTAAYAQATASALQEIFDTQVRRMGWAEPIRDADGRYRAYIGEAEGSMGYTKVVQFVFDNPNTASVRERAAARTVFMIDNDFAGMGKEAPPESLMRATATHEFNHVVQHAYDAEEELRWLYESTASWIETATVGRDQDATDYVETDFAAPELCWTTTTPGHDYGQWTLLQSLADRFGPDIVVQLWRNTVAYDGFETMTRTLTPVGSDIPDAIQYWRAQNYARDYELAALFARAVRLEGTINRTGAWGAKGGLEQLGAHYYAVRGRGQRLFTLSGDSNLELIGLGVRNGEVQVFRLGRSGVFDTAGFQHAAIMVFNRAVPEAPGACSGVGYELNVTDGAQAMGAAAYRFSGAHFRAPS